MYLKLNSQEQIYSCYYHEDTSNMITNLNINNIKDFSTIISALSRDTLDADIYSDEDCTVLIASFKENKIVSSNIEYEDGTMLIVIKPTSLQKEINNLKDTISIQTEQIASIDKQINPDPIDPSTLSIEDAKVYQLNIVNVECTETIHAGIDVETTQGTEHFALTEVDQINITALYTQCMAGTASVPYHADSKICREFSAEEMILLGKKSLEYVIYCTTLCNHIRAWINRSETVEEVIAIHFGSQLPDDLQESFNSIINIGNVENEANNDELVEDTNIEEN